MTDFLPTLNAPISEREAYILNPLVLAFVGDAVQQLFVRTKHAMSTTLKAGDLHKLAINEIKAVSQADKVDTLLPIFTQQELDIYKRARNSKVNSVAKNASLADYKKASGFEAVIGYLYLSGNHQRLLELFSYC